MKSGSFSLADCVWVSAVGSVSVTGAVNCWARMAVTESRRREKRRAGTHQETWLRFSTFASIRFLLRVGTVQALERSVSVAREQGCARRDGVRAERGGDNLCRFKAGLEGAPPRLADDRLEDQFPRFHDAAA